MLFQTFFREKALARRSEREAVDARLQITAPHEWLLVSGLGAALLVLLAYGLLGRAERSLTIETVLVQPGERVDVVAGVSGVVVDVLAEVGDAVASGQAIARVRTAGADRWDAVLSRLLESLENAEGAPGPVAAEILGALAAPGSEAGQRLTEDPATQDIVASHDGELVTLALAVGRRVAAGELAARIRAESPARWRRSGSSLARTPCVSRPTCGAGARGRAGRWRPPAPAGARRGSLRPRRIPAAMADRARGRATAPRPPAARHADGAGAGSGLRRRSGRLADRSRPPSFVSLLFGNDGD